MFSELNTSTITYKDMHLKYTYYNTDPSGQGCVIEIVNRDAYRLSRFKGLEGHLFFDIGANNGLATIILAKQNPKSKVVVVEPISELCEVIRKNIKDNDLENVVLIESALHTDANGTTLYLASSCSGASSTSVNNENAFSIVENKIETRNVDTVTFDALCEKFLLDNQRITLLKIDCEGAEFALFDSSKFKSKCVDYLEGEFHDTVYNASDNQSATQLFEFCKMCVNIEMRVTKLTRNENASEESIMSFKAERF